MMGHKTGSAFSSAIYVFFIVTSCITIMQGAMGALLWPEDRVGFSAFLTPPLFGLLSALSGVVLCSGRELTMKQMAFRMVLQLLLIEAMVFIANLLFGDFASYTPTLIVLLAGTIAVIYGVVWLLLWMNDRRTAREFNRYLLKFQEEQEEATV